MRDVVAKANPVPCSFLTTAVVKAVVFNCVNGKGNFDNVLAEQKLQFFRTSGRDQAIKIICVQKSRQFSLSAFYLRCVPCHFCNCCIVTQIPLSKFPMHGAVTAARHVECIWRLRIHENRTQSERIGCVR